MPRKREPLNRRDADAQPGERPRPGRDGEEVDASPSGIARELSISPGRRSACVRAASPRALDDDAIVVHDGDASGARRRVQGQHTHAVTLPVRQTSLTVDSCQRPSSQQCTQPSAVHAPSCQCRSRAVGRAPIVRCMHLSAVDRRPADVLELGAHVHVGDAGDASVPRRQAAASRRHPVLPDGRLLRDVLRGRARRRRARSS